jgi:hypothetical protein
MVAAQVAAPGPGSGGLPGRRPDQHFGPPPTPVAPGAAAGIVRARTVIIFGGGTGSGIFVYDGTPALGTLIGSWTGQAGTDQYGNSYPQGLSVSVGEITGALIDSPQVTVTQGPLLLYGNTTQVIVPFTASGNFTAPSGVTSASVVRINGGQGGQNGSASAGGKGGKGGDAVVTTVTLTPTHVYTVTVGAAGAANLGLGGTSAFTGDSETILNTFTGGLGGAGVSFLAGGGGSSGGSSQPGNAGGVNGAGATAPVGGGDGGDGGAFGPGQAGSQPGGGGGGGGELQNGGAGAAGSVVITYSTSGASTLETVLAATAGSDAFGNSWVAGLTQLGNMIIKAGLQITTSPTVNAVLKSDASGNASWDGGALNGSVSTLNGSVSTLNGSVSTINTLLNGWPKTFFTQLVAANLPLPHQTTANPHISTTAGTLSTADRNILNGWANAINTLQANLQAANMQS